MLNSIWCWEPPWILDWHKWHPQWGIIAKCKVSYFSAISWQEQVTCWWDDEDICFVLDQNEELNFYIASSLKKQATSWHITLLRHIILILRQPVFILTPLCYVLSGEAANTNCKVFEFEFWCLKPLSAIFKLYHGDHFQWWRKPEYPERTTDPGQATGKLYHLRLRVECTLFCNLQSRAGTDDVLMIWVVR